MVGISSNHDQYPTSASLTEAAAQSLFSAGRQSGVKDERFEELKRAPGRLDAGVAVAAELHVDAARVLDAMQCFEDGGEVHRPRAKHQVLVHAAHHVFDVQVDDPRAQRWRCSAIESSSMQ